MRSQDITFLRTKQGERGAESRKKRLLEVMKEKELLMVEGCSKKSHPNLRIEFYQPRGPRWSSPPCPSRRIPSPQGQAPPVKPSRTEIAADLPSINTLPAICDRLQPA